MHAPTSLPILHPARGANAQTSSRTVARQHTSTRGAAGIGTRALAFGIDLMIYVAAAPFTIGLTALILRPWWPLGAIAIGLGYCAVSASCGQSPGMRLVGVHLIDARTGHCPTVRQSLLRSLLVVVPLGAAFTLLSAPIPSPTDPAMGMRSAVLVFCMLFIGLGLIDHLWAYGDRERRTLHDRLSATAVLEAEPPRRA